MELFNKHSNKAMWITLPVLVAFATGCGSGGGSGTATVPNVVTTTTPTTTTSSGSSGGGGGGGDTTAPVGIVTTVTIADASDAALGKAVVQSNETGTAYLVNDLVAVTTVASITGAADNYWNQVTIAAANTNTDLLTTGLSSGTYHVYTVDAAGNISGISANAVTISSYALTASITDNLSGTAGADIFIGTYLQDGTGTFNTTDTINGLGGSDTLKIIPNGVQAITPSDAYWTNISNIEKIVFNTTGAGAQTLTTGANFETKFSGAGVDLTTTSSDGAINITMNGPNFTGATVITTTSGAGAQTIITGSGSDTVTATSAAGALTINGVGLTTVTATTTGAGAQTIGDGVGGGIALVTVTASSFSGAQTITSTSPAAVTVNATKTGVAGAQTIITGTGNDIINILGTDAGLVSITSGAGADTITLKAGHTAVNTIVQAATNSKAATASVLTGGGIAIGNTITFGNSLDNVTNFIGATDVLNVGTPGAAISCLTLDPAALTATKTIYFSGAYVGNTFTIAANGAGADTLLLDTTAVNDQVATTADSWILLKGTVSTSLIAGTFI